MCNSHESFRSLPVIYNCTASSKRLGEHKINSSLCPQNSLVRHCCPSLKTKPKQTQDKSCQSIRACGFKYNDSPSGSPDHVLAHLARIVCIGYESILFWNRSPEEGRSEAWFIVERNRPGTNKAPKPSRGAADKARYRPGCPALNWLPHRDPQALPSAQSSLTSTWKPLL